MRHSVKSGLIIFLLALGSASAADALTVDSGNRSAVVDTYHSVYKAVEGISAGWTGDVATCEAGTIDSTYQNAGLTRLNYFRAMAGLPALVTLNSVWSDKCQEASLMMTANRKLSHSPPSSWECFSAAGDEAAGKSNLAGGYPNVTSAMTGFMLDSGVPSAGHRRWMLYPPLEEVGIGATFGNSYPAHALWVIGGWGTRPSTPEWVAWPPEGFVPYDLVSRYWSFSFPGASFSGAAVTMTHEGNSVNVTLQSIANGFGDNTLVWTPIGVPTGAPDQDLRFGVTVDGVSVGGTTRSFAYDVILIDPNSTVSVIAGDNPTREQIATLLPNSPNPFRSETVIQYRLTETSHITIEILDISGAFVSHLVNRVQVAGTYSLVWDGRDENGRKLSSGVYFVRLGFPAGRSMQKVIFLN